MAVDQNKVLAAAQAGFPELWPEVRGNMPLPNTPALAVARQQAIGRAGAVLEAYDSSSESESTSDMPGAGESLTIVMPEDAAMVQQALTIVMYLDSEGQVAYSCVTAGEGLLTSWLGMIVLAQDFIIDSSDVRGNRAG